MSLILHSYWCRMKSLFTVLPSFYIWALSSLLAISFIGTRPYIGLAIAILGGVAMGLMAIVSHRAPRREGTSRDIEEGTAAGPGMSPRRLAEWVAAHELWFLGVAILLLIFPNHTAPLGLIVVSLLWLIRWMTRGHLSVRTPVDVPILGLLVMIPMALYASVDLGMSRIILYQILAGVALFYGLVNSVHSEKGVWRMALLLALAGAGLAMVGPLGTNWDSKFFALPGVYERFPLLLPDAINANVLAGALAMIVPVGLSLLLWTNSSFLARRRVVITRALLGLALVLMLATFILTQSRGAYLALGVGMLLLAALRNRWFLLIPILVALGSVIAIQRLDVTQAIDLLLVIDALGGWPVRQEIWSRAIT